MRENVMLKKMRKGQQVLGTFMELDDTLIVEALGVSGLDFFIVDFEHSTFTTESLKLLVQAADLRNMTPLMRVKDITRSDILRPLDIGVQGLIIPNVHSVEEVERIVKWGKYAPVGERGFFTSRVIDFGYDDNVANLNTLFEKRNTETLIIPQCETVESLEMIEEIAAIEGVAGIFIGPFDLSIALGIPTQFDNPIFIKALERIYKACRDNDKFAFIFGANTEMAKTFVDYGFDAITCSMDINLLIDATKNMIDTLKK